jgi:hypothetical protein
MTQNIWLREKIIVNNVNPYVVFKWLKSENTSSYSSRQIAKKTRKTFGLTAKQYRKLLSWGREKFKVLERLMSENRWDEIEFDKIPSKAGIVYRNAFARHDIERMKANKELQSYADFAKDETKTVNADVLNPCDVVHEAFKGSLPLNSTQRTIVNKYWDNLKDYFDGASFNGVAVVDTSGSMRGGAFTNEIAPIDVAISLGMYCAEKCSKDSPWYGHYITFSRNARLVPVDGVDFVDKVQRIYRANLCENTNIKSVFDLILRLAVENHVKPENLMKNIIIISDMQFDRCIIQFQNYESELEFIAQEWKSYNYELPRLIFWNVDARRDSIPMMDNGRVTFVSGYSPTLFEQILTNKTGLDLMLDKLNDKRYALIK